MNKKSNKNITRKEALKKWGGMQRLPHLGLYDTKP